MRVRRIVDLSIPIDPATPVYPGDPAPRLAVHATIASVGFNLLQVTMGSQSGTHVDAPYHFVESGARVDDLPLDLFIGPAVVIDVRHVPARTPVGPEVLAAARERLVPGAVVLFHTGWSAHRATSHYLEHPFLAPETAQALVAAGVRTLGIDALSVDETPTGEHRGSGFAAHHILAGAGAVIIENLVGLDALLDLRDPLVCTFPIKLAGADGAPVRAVAIEFEE